MNMVDRTLVTLAISGIFGMMWTIAANINDIAHVVVKNSSDAVIKKECK